MPQPCCDHRIFCPEGAGNLDFDSPLKNISAEAADPITFLGINWGWDRKAPPVNRWWITNSCLGVCESGISQADADACAARNELDCLVPGWNDPAPQNPPPGPPEVPPRIPVPIYTNNPESCSSQCPDGLTFTYTTPAGKYGGLSQIQADRMAASEACRFAISARMCLSALAPRSCCTGHQYLAVLHCAGGVLPLGFTVVSGSLPPGIVLSQGPGDRDVSLAGSPSAGSFTFTIRVDDSIGNFMQKTYTLEVGGIDQATLPDAPIGVAYSETLTASNLVAPFLWEIASGTLPDGLDLNSASGEIFGTPTTLGDSTFVVRCTDFLGTACTRSLTIHVSAGITCVSFVDSIAGVTGLITGAKDAALGRILIDDGAAMHLIRTDTDASIVAPATPSNGNLAAYARIAQKFVFSDAAGGYRWIDAIAGGGSAVIGNNTDIFGRPDYSPEDDLIYGCGVDFVTFHAFITAFNANTSLVTSKTDMGIFAAGGYEVLYTPTPKRLFVSLQDQRIFNVYSLPGLALVGTVNLTGAPLYAFGSVYHPITGKLYFAMDDGTIREVNPSTLATDATIASTVLPIGNTLHIDINPTNGALYVGGNGNLAVINPMTRALVCVVNFSATGAYCGVDRFSEKVYSTDFTANAVKAFHQ